jgi:polysaccharide deacetylase family protein (PEP-CTERM system associated)
VTRPNAEVVNAFTIDFEDWYHGIEIPESGWARLEDRIARSGERLLTMLQRAGVRGTFFVLGALAERHPELVRAVADAGHEIGTHGWSHTMVYQLEPERFDAELRRSIALLAAITGAPIRGHRAPYFSITRRSLWAFERLAAAGIRYDSSVFPVVNYRYGIPDAPRWPYRVATAAGTVLEFPITTLRWFGRNVPMAGGAYFRIYPYLVTRVAFASVNAGGRPAVFYLHPWELDPDHPRIPLPRRVAVTHYANLRSTEPKLRRLLEEVRFAPMSEVLDVD